MILKTARLRWRPYGPGDAEHLRLLRGEPSVWRYSTFEPDDDLSSAHRALEGILSRTTEGTDTPGALFDLEGRFVGEAGVYAAFPVHGRANFGYNLLPEFWGRGYATEITRTLVSALMAQGRYHRIEATVLEANTASCRVLEKCGFVREALLERYLIVQGTPQNLVYYRLPFGPAHASTSPTP